MCENEKSDVVWKVKMSDVVCDVQVCQREWCVDRYLLRSSQRTEVQQTCTAAPS